MPETFGTILPDGTGGRNPISYGDDGKDKDLDGEDITYSCYYDSIIDSKVEENSPNFCSNLGINLDSKTGLIDWKPGFDQAGVYEIKVKAESLVTSSSHIFSDMKQNISQEKNW